MPDQKPYDVVIIGAGISGAMLAYKLAQAGQRVLILEAGSGVPANRGDYMERFYLQLAKTPESPYPPDPNAARPTVLDIPHAWSDEQEGYLIQKGPLPFSSTWERRGGGTTWHWLGTSLRLLPNDFRLYSAYGVGTPAHDWPLGYDDLEPYYGLAEHEIGVAADVQDQEYLGLHFGTDPSKPYSYPMPGIVQSYLDQRIAARIGTMTLDGNPVTVSPTPQARNSRPFDDRRVCAGNTNCIPICPIQAKYDASIHLARAQNLGVEVWNRTVADRVLADPATRQITGISYRRYEDPEGPVTGTGTVTARRYVLAAHAVEVPKLLLNSRTDAFPDGIANSSDQVGRNLMDHPIQLNWGLMPEPVYPFRGPLSTSGIESLRDGPFRRDRAAFRIEIGNEGWNWAAGDPWSTVNTMINGAHFGSDLRTKLHDQMTRTFRFGALVEQIGQAGNRVVPSPTETDHLGIPRPVITYDLAEYTKAGYVAANAAARTLFQRMGATDSTQPPSPGGASTFEYPPCSGQYFMVRGAGHTMGTYRMGTDPKTSVVDARQRSHDHPNLFLLGSGVFPSVGTANPTLTIAALTLMAAETILSDLKTAPAANATA